MKVEVRPVNGGNFDIEVESYDKSTVGEIKKIISTEKGWDVEGLKLIIKGKIMQEDDKFLSDYDYKSGSFIVCMVSKAKPKPAAAAPPPSTPAVSSISANNNTSSSLTAPSTGSSAMETTTNTNAGVSDSMATPRVSSETNSRLMSEFVSSTQQQHQTTATNTNSTPNQAQQQPSLTATPEFQNGLTMLKEMGFPESECEIALRAAFGNTDRAVEYLMNGIPQGMLETLGANNAGIAPGSVAGNTTTTTAAPPAQQQQQQPSGGLAGLRKNPILLNQLKRIVQNDPSKLSDVLQKISTTDPNLFKAIQEDQAGFVNLMNEPIVEATQQQQTQQQQGLGMFGAGGGMGIAGGNEAEPNPHQQLMMLMQSYQQMNAQQRLQLAAAMGMDPQELASMVQMMQQLPPEAVQQILAGGMGGGMGGGSQIPPGAHVIHLTQEQAASVARLQELGFPRQACVEALLACDNNEEMAANYLFMNPPGGNDEGDDEGDDQHFG